MDVYAEIDQRRAERAARRIARIEREQRVESVMAPLRMAAKVAVGVIFFYAMMFCGLFWATM